MVYNRKNKSFHVHTRVQGSVTSVWFKLNGYKIKLNNHKHKRATYVADISTRNYRTLIKQLLNAYPLTPIYIYKGIKSKETGKCACVSFVKTSSLL